ncbi:MAG: DEAD/DEAH box helicase family protein [Candidatus Methylumidiphilus sp.]
MKQPTLSGHTRLKNSLVLRNALAAELGLNLAHVMPHLFQVEDAVGAQAALDEGRYGDALVSVCQGDRNLIFALDAAVREACAKARLAPRYAQYLALLLFAHWNTARLEDSEGFLARLNGFHDPVGANSFAHDAVTNSFAHDAAKRRMNSPLQSEILEPFTATDLQTAAFWMATAAGKTHVLHACLALLQAEGPRWDRIVLITPSEALTRQHADKLLELQQWEVFAYPMDGDQSALGRLPDDTVIVIDINKLSDSKKGDGVTVPMSVFKDGRNLVFVDEGHKGQRSEASVWKKLQQDLAGIGAAQQDSHRGLLVEFSATFGQVAEAEHAFSRYAKSIVFDYAYDRFHADLYGKDFWHLKLEGRGEASAAAYSQTLTAALIAYWHQLDCFQRGKTLALQENLQIAKPLWVLLGLSVIGGKTKGDQEQTSDVVDVLRYLHKVLHGPEHWLADLTGVLDVQTIGTDLLPPEARSALAGYQPKVLAERILSDVFGWQAGDKPVFRLLKNASGELGLGLLRADAVHYFGVVNVGDAAGLKKKLEESSLIVEDDALSASLFAELALGDSLINVLIGSRRFAEGWDNYRASSLTLLRLGQGEGSLIIQMFGRVVRFAGRNGDGRRLRHPSSALKPLQTAYVYGLRSKYLEAFLAGLYENGVDASPDEADFNRARIVFPKDKTAYIETVLSLLIEDNEIDRLLKDAALAYHGNNAFAPFDEAGYDLALRVRTFQGSESEFVATLIKDYLKPDANGKLGTWAQNQRRLQLMDYAKTGLFGLGEEKVPFFRDHPAPCEELWKRMSAKDKPA